MFNSQYKFYGFVFGALALGGLGHRATRIEPIVNERGWTWSLGVSRLHARLFGLR